MSIGTNHQIATLFFWEHIQFGWGYPSRTVNRPVFYREYRDLVVQFTKESIEQMPLSNEHDLLVGMLRARYGEALIPSEVEMQFPADRDLDNLQNWQPAYEFLRKAYGPQVGVFRRSSKEPHVPQSSAPVMRDLLVRSLLFSPIDKYAFEAELGTKQRASLILQEFPREHLYCVMVEGQHVALFDDLPRSWSIQPSP